MLKEKIEILDTVEKEVITTTQVIENTKVEFKRLKKDLKKLLWKHKITKDMYNENLYKLRIAYKTQQTDLKLIFDKEVTYFVNQYEDFNDFKVQNDVTLEKESLLIPIAKQIYDLKFLISQEKDKIKKQKLKQELALLKGQKSDTKILYSKTIKNKYFLYGSLACILAIILGTLLLTYLFANKSKIDFNNPQFILGFSIAMISLVFVLFYIFWMVWHESKKWVLDRHKPTFSTIGHSIWMFILNSLGIGVFAPMTATFKKTGLFNDLKKMPFTLNTACVVGGLFGGILTLTSVPIDGWTLLIFVLMCGIGGAIGSKIVRVINAKKLAFVMGVILSIATLLMFLSLQELGIFKTGNLTSLTNNSDNWWRLLIAIIMFFGFGMLLSFGIGIYAPTMVLISLLGMQFTCAFPIMMLCAASSGSVNAFVSMKKNNYLPKTSWAILVGSIIGDAIYFIVVYVLIIKVGGVNFDIVSRVFKWIAVPVIGYSAYLLLRNYWRLRKTTLSKRIKKTHLQLIDLETIDYEFMLKNNLNIIKKANINYNQRNLKLKYQFIHW